MLFERLSESEKNAISNHICAYAGKNSIMDDIASLDYILRFWDVAKSEYLADALFKDNFIISKEIAFFEGEEEIINRINRNLHHSLEHGDVIREIIEFYEPNKDKGFNTSYSVYWAVVSLTSSNVLATNIIPEDWDEAKEIPLPNNSTIKLQTGAKVMKILCKIAKAIGINETRLEAFRNAHSLCLNQKKLTGTLNISIHPLDYMTMSDNDLGWSSCMSWSGYGEYRQGTVEMMNSPCVIVAYLSSDHNMVLSDGSEWNNKKWRCLFIVDPNFILSIKSYPYYNENLTKETIKMIAERLGWGSVEPVKFSPYCRQANRIGDIDVNIYPDANAMYNDFGSTTHYITINPEYSESNLDEPDYNYSGASECMCCGEEEYFQDDGAETRLCCYNCEAPLICSNCGERIYDGDCKYEINGEWFCESCYEDECYYDDVLSRDRIVADQPPRTIYLSRKNDTKDFFGPVTTWRRDIVVGADTIGSEEWKRCFTCDTVHHDPKNLIYWVCPNELVDEAGYTIFGLNHTRLQDYMDTVELDPFF